MMAQISSAALFASDLDQVPLLYPLSICVLIKSFSPTPLLSLQGKGHAKGSNAGAQLRLASSLAPYVQPNQPGFSSISQAA